MGRNPLHTKLCDMLGIDFPIIAFTHCKDVVASVVNAGGFGFYRVAYDDTLRGRLSGGALALLVREQPTIRKALDDKNVDAVSIATPNHWHALASIWAIQAGKDVYVEKPVSHCVWEGRQIVNAARKYSKIVQTGTQSRSSRKGIAEAVKYVQEGNLGKILLSRGLCYKRRASIGKAEGEQKVWVSARHHAHSARPSRDRRSSLRRRAVRQPDRPQPASGSKR